MGLTDFSGLRYDTLALNANLPTFLLVGFLYQIGLKATNYNPQIPLQLESEEELRFQLSDVCERDLESGSVTNATFLLLLLFLTSRAVGRH